MDSNMLFQAAREGKLEVLERLLQENPSILADIRLTSLAESVLHVATKSGQLNFVHELMKIDPDIARELNKDGFRPLDIAVIMGNLAIVKNILSFDRDLGRLTGTDNRTALHYAALKGRVEIIEELLSACPGSLQDITVHGETALHLAVKNYQFDTFYELVKWLERLSKESIINIQDGDGNTVLHLAVSTKQYACLNLLLDENCFIRGTIELNVPNGEGLTALDISDMDIQDSYDAKVRETLQRGGAIRTKEDPTTMKAQHSPQLETNSQPKIQHHLQSEPSRNWFEEYFKFQKQRDSPSEARNAQLVVAALIATITFQTGVSPPPGLFDESQKSNPMNLSAFTSDFILLFFNSLGFLTSSCIIIYLTAGFPLYRELYTSIFSMLIAHGAVTDITIRGTKAERKIRGMAYVLQGVAFALPCLMRWIPLLGKIARNYWRRWAVTNARLPTGN